MWEKLASALEQDPELLIIKPERGFDLTFYTKYGQAVPKEKQNLAVTIVLKFLSENPWIQAKIYFNKWIEETMEKLDLQIRRGLPRTALKKAPKIERSEIFKPKYQAVPEQPLPEEEEELIEEKKAPIQEAPATQPVEPPPSLSEALAARSKIQKQPFFLTAKERENEYARWPAYIERELPEEREPTSLEIPSITEATKKFGPPKPTIDASHIPEGDAFQLKIFMKKEAEDEPIPPMPYDDPFGIVIYLEKLVKKDYEMRKMADVFEEGMESIRQTLFYTDFLTEMSKVITILREADPGLTLSEQNRRDILHKIAKWKDSPRWKSSLKRKK